MKKLALLFVMSCISYQGYAAEKARPHDCQIGSGTFAGDPWRACSCKIGKDHRCSSKRHEDILPTSLTDLIHPHDLKVNLLCMDK